jgi:uncharacterized phage protein (TIGR01671 family)
MQYTGLKDKNGKEIYEGDILRYNYHQDEKNDIADIDFLGEVVYDTGKISTGWENDEINYVGFLLKGGEPFPSVADIEVIGNIYENPELLKTA